MFTACFDASGHESDQPYLAVGGFISSRRDWNDFDMEWRDRLAFDGLQYFRMVDFSHSTNQFVSWKGQEPRRQNLLSDLLRIIDKHAYRKFGQIVDIGAIGGNLSDQIRMDYKLSAYVLAARTCAGNVRQWTFQNSISSFELVFEDGDVGKGNLIERLRKDAFPNISFKPKKDAVKDGIPEYGFTPLQAADIWAYELFQTCKRENLSRWPMQQLMRIPGDIIGIYDPKSVKELDIRIQQINLGSTFQGIK